MMNLEVGKYYLLVQTGGCTKRGRIESKNEDDERSHVYMIAWPHPTGPNSYGIYVHDHGWAERLEFGQEVKTYFSVSFPSAVYAYRELLESEYMSMKIWFAQSMIAVITNFGDTSVK